MPFPSEITFDNELVHQGSSSISSHVLRRRNQNMADGFKCTGWGTDHVDLGNVKRSAIMQTDLTYLALETIEDNLWSCTSQPKQPTCHVSELGGDNGQHCLSSSMQTPRYLWYIVADDVKHSVDVHMQNTLWYTHCLSETSLIMALMWARIYRLFAVFVGEEVRHLHKSGTRLNELSTVCANTQKAFCSKSGTNQDFLSTDVATSLTPVDVTHSAAPLWWRAKETQNASTFIGKRLSIYANVDHHLVAGTNSRNPPWVWWMLTYSVMHSNTVLDITLQQATTKAAAPVLRYKWSTEAGIDARARYCNQRRRQPCVYSVEFVVTKLKFLLFLAIRSHPSLGYEDLA